MRISDWSSDVCSSDLLAPEPQQGDRPPSLDLLERRARFDHVERPGEAGDARSGKGRRSGRGAEEGLIGSWIPALRRVAKGGVRWTRAQADGVPPRHPLQYISAQMIILAR